MNIQFLPKFRRYKSSDDFIYQQAVLYNHLGQSACPFCLYQYEQQTTTQHPIALTFQECSEKHSCLLGLMPYILMRPLNEDEIEDATSPDVPDTPCYTCTSFWRQVKVKSMSRYVQFVASILKGYPCNSLCHYYIDRVDKKQAALACGKTHACANNSSFWNLLVPNDVTLFSEYQVDMSHPNDTPSNQ